MEKSNPETSVTNPAPKDGLGTERSYLSSDISGRSDKPEAAGDPAGSETKGATKVMPSLSDSTKTMGTIHKSGPAPDSKSGKGKSKRSAKGGAEQGCYRRGDSRIARKSDPITSSDRDGICRSFVVERRLAPAAFVGTGLPAVLYRKFRICTTNAPGRPGLPYALG